MIFYKDGSALFYPKEGMYRRDTGGGEIEKGFVLVTEDDFIFITEDEQFSIALEKDNT